MGKLIEDAEAATRLARAIMSDITLYNGSIDEGRALFRSRVSPARHPLFEEILAAWPPPHGVARSPAPEASPTPREQPAHDPMQEAQDRLDAAVALRSKQSLIAGFVIFAVVVSAIVSYEIFSSQHHGAEPERHHDEPVDKKEGHSGH